MDVTAIAGKARRKTNMVKVSEFLEEYNMHYEVRKEQATRTNSEGAVVEIPGQYNLVRSTDEQVISPSTVRDGYVATNPTKMIAPMEPMISEGWVSPSHCYLFKEGSHEILTFRIDAGQLEDKGRINGEGWDHYLSLHNHQGGGGKARGLIHSRRDVCKNAVVALSKSTGFAIRHTGNFDQNYEWAIQTWKRLQEEIRKLSQRMTVLADTTITPNEAVKVIREIYGVDDKSEEDISTRTKNELDFAIREFSNPRRGTAGRTLADVYNAITSTNTHYTPAKSKETELQRMSTMLDPQGSRHKLEAVTVVKLFEMAGLDS